MRGTPAALLGSDQHRGIIPAHAGNTCLLAALILRCWDHPRACGEHMSEQDFYAHATGSSPRMRGTLIVDQYAHNATGIIPAHAGNTCLPYCKIRKTRDHPRACGEHYGSPVVPCISLRIIPAHAGNTGRTRSMCSECRDHPRACGEHSAASSSRTIAPGSSPRMRGTLISS